MYSPVQRNDDDFTYSNTLQQPPPPSKYTRARTVALFGLCTLLLFADQNLMAPNLTAIARDFGFDDQQRDEKLGGEIALAFFLLGAPASFVVGCLGDVWKRTLLFAWTVGIGEGACLATFFTRTYPQLYVCRAVTGFSIGGALPLIFSILGDLYPADQRHFVSALVGVGTGLGMAFGQGVAGFLGPTYGWRLPFLVVSLPALFCTALVLFTVEEPERGAMEEAVIGHRIQVAAVIDEAEEEDGNNNLEQYFGDNKNAEQDVEMLLQGLSKAVITKTDADTPVIDDAIALDDPTFDLSSPFKTFHSLLQTPTLVLALFQGAPGCLPWGIINSYLNDFLAADRGMTVQYATMTILMFGFGNLFGMGFGGYLGSYLYRIDKRYPALLAGAVAILACFPLWTLLNCIENSTPFLTVAIVSSVAGVGSGMTGPIIKATLQNVTVPQARGQAFALFNTFDDLGKGLGPAFIAILISRLGGRTPAFNVGTCGWLVCGLFNLCIFWTVERDERNVQEFLVASQLKKQCASQGDSGYGSVCLADDNPLDISGTQ